MSKRKVSKMKVYTQVPSTHIKQWEGIHPKEEDYDFVVDGNAKIYNSQNVPIAIVYRGIFTDEQLDAAYPALRLFREDRNFWSDNRGQYSGQIERIHKVKKDGTISRQGRCKSIASGIAGYYESIGGRFKFPRETKYLQKYPDQWESLMPMFRICGAWMQTAVKDRYEVQMDAVKKTAKDWVIPGTPFTTITVNNCVPAAYHQDSRDLKEGMGCMMVYRRGEYDGFELVIPEYRFAINMRHGDVLYFNPCIWHANMLPKNAVGEEGEDWERISVVMYFRKNLMKEPPKEEALKKVKKRESERYMGISE
jgi:hypothetical protein